MAFGFASPNYSIGPPPGIAPKIPAAPEVIDAFNQGQLAGQQFAINGLPLPPECVDASENDLAAAEGLFGLMHTYDAIALAKAGALGASLVAGVIAFIDLSIAVQTFHKDPEEVLPGLGEQFVSLLSDLGVGSMEIYCSVGVDNSVQGCQIKLSSLFRSLDQARDAAVAMARPQWLIARWRTDQSGSLTIVESS
jgi:hypothetical protein